MKVKRESEVAQSCPTLSDPMDCSLLGSSIHGIFQARVLEIGAETLYKDKHTLSLDLLIVLHLTSCFLFYFIFFCQNIFLAFQNFDRKDLDIFFKTGGGQRCQ